MDYLVRTRGLTPRLTGAGARSVSGTNSGHKNAEGMPAVCVRVEPMVRLQRVVEGRKNAWTLSLVLHLQVESTYCLGHLGRVWQARPAAMGSSVHKNRESA
jgi:hypothetical protein